MYTAIKNYCNNENQNGLLLLDMPTGFGKTYSVLKYIHEASLDERNKDRRFFFITTLKKNLPTDELKKMFERSGHLDKFNDKFLFIDSNADAVIENLTPEITRKIPYKITKTDEYKSLGQDVSFIQKQSRLIDVKSLVGSIKDDLRTKTEPSFRKMIQTVLAKEFPTVNDRIYAIKTKEEWKWLGSLYPAVFTRDKQIIFMSMDKFLTRNATIVEPSYMFYNSDIINNAVIFIDEFDATKETMLKNIIQNGLRDKFDYVELFKDIYSALYTNKFPAVLTTSSKSRLEGKYKGQSLQSIIDGIKEKADEIYQTYSLQFSHRTDSELVDNSKNFIFQDHQFHSILDGNNLYVSAVSDSKRQLNTICFSKKLPDENNNIQVMLGKLRGFVSWFQKGIHILALNYLQHKLEHRKKDEDEFTIEYAIRSVLSLFRLNSAYIDYLTTQILMSVRKERGSIQGAEFDLSFYERGFRFYSFEDDSMHDMQSRIMMCSFQTTPEKILLRFCEKAKVIGISATATLRSVIGNFDIDYLKLKLQDSYETLSEDDKNRIWSDFSHSIKGYDKVKINVELLGESIQDNYSVTTWNSIFDNAELAKNIYGQIERSTDTVYNKERYVRIALAYKNFISHEDIQSFLCVLTKHPRKGDGALDLNILEEIFKFLCNEYAAKYNIDYKETFCQLDGDEYDSKKEEVVRKLSNGKKLFVISVYQTIGAGQNLQYKIPSNVNCDLIQTNERSSKGEKDFDAIYLDKPTNILVSFINNNISEEEFVKYLFHTEYLQEASEISISVAISHIKKAFRSYISGKTDNSQFAPNLYGCKSVSLFSTRTIIQAIGRICRTNQKRKNIYIYADSRIAESIDFSVSEDRILNCEFMALLNKLQEYNLSKEIKERSLVNKAELTSVKVNKFIINMLRDGWKEDRMIKWQKLRQLVLSFPTMPEQEFSKNFIASNFYVQLPVPNDRLYYQQSEDFNNVKIWFEQNKDAKNEVSENSAKLKIIMGNSAIKEYFERNNWATGFEKNYYIMSPTLFNNIYKGALGEVVGKFLLEQILDVIVEDIDDPELFELFDFRLKDLPIYVDFKNWHETTIFDNSQMLKKIEEKVLKCKCKYVLICNIISQSKWEVKSYRSGDLKILQVPSLLDENNPNHYCESAINKIRECINECCY